MVLKEVCGWFVVTHHHHYHQSFNREGRWGTTDDFATSFLHELTLEGALSALMKKNPLTSLKIDGRGDNIVVLLRFSTGQPVNTATRRSRLKPPSQLARDRGTR